MSKLPEMFTLNTFIQFYYPSPEIIAIILDYNIRKLKFLYRKKTNDFLNFKPNIPNLENNDFLRLKTNYTEHFLRSKNKQSESKKPNIPTISYV